MNRAYLLQELKCAVTEIVELQEQLTLTNNFREVRRIEKRLKEVRCLKNWLLQQLDCITDQQTA
ncbi:MAG TPA: hypothetical protein DER60_11430 [Syntrophomonas sp.]|nr:hypothetical protein [Syntrophomonas sp.]